MIMQLCSLATVLVLWRPDAQDDIATFIILIIIILYRAGTGLPLVATWSNSTHYRTFIMHCPHGLCMGKEVP